MSPAEGHDVLAADAGAHVLGALTDAEETRFVRHLRACPLCQEEVARLAEARDALPRTVPMFEAPPRIKAAVMEAVRAELPPEPAAPADRVRRRGARLIGGMRLRVASLSASVVLAAGLAIGFGVAHLTEGGGGSGTQTRTVAASFDQSRAARASGSMLIAAGGDDANATLRVHGMPGLPRDRVYQVWLQRGGETIPKALFTVGANGEGLTAVDGELKGAKAVLVTSEAAGGARSPTSTPILRVKL